MATQSLKMYFLHKYLQINFSELNFLYNFADTSKYKYMKGDKVCFTEFTF